MPALLSSSDCTVRQACARRGGKLAVRRRRPLRRRSHAPPHCRSPSLVGGQPQRGDGGGGKAVRALRGADGLCHIRGLGRVALRPGRVRPPYPKRTLMDADTRRRACARTFAHDPPLASTNGSLTERAALPDFFRAGRAGPGRAGARARARAMELRRAIPAAVASRRRAGVAAGPAGSSTAVSPCARQRRRRPAAGRPRLPSPTPL